MQLILLAVERFLLGFLSSKSEVLPAVQEIVDRLMYDGGISLCFS